MAEWVKWRKVARTPTTQTRDYELTLADSNARVVERLANRAFEDQGLFLLCQRAANLSLVKGFDKLLSLATISFTPFPYQLETAQTVLRRFRGRALLCDEVGLGKTIEAGIVLDEYLLRGLVRKVLILTPPALVSQWREEMMEKFGLSFVTHDDPQFREKGVAAWGEFDQVIASLHTARKGENARAILAQRYDMVIADEAHHLKSRSTVSWQFVNSLDKKYILLLTATPVQNSLEELFNLITILKPGQLKTMSGFKKEFVTRGDARLPKNRGRLQELLFDVMVRNTRSQVDLKLPKRHATTVKLTLSPAERQLYDSITAFVRTEHPRVGHGERGVNRLTLETLQMEAGSSGFAVLPTLERMATNPRNSEAQREELRRLVDLAKGVRESAKAAALVKLLRATRDKALVFTKYLATLDYLARFLEQTGFSVAVYHGGLTAAQKDAAIDDFERGKPVLLCTEAAGEGRNLQFCNTMINYDLPWNPMRIEQRIGRIHRIGQTREVYIYNLSAEGTIENYILWLLDNKINMFELVIGEMDMILGNLADERDFEEIITDIWVRSGSREEVQQRVEVLGDELVRAKEEYLKTKEYDEVVFGQDYRAE
ncbi:MAG: SNF2-related protein [Dehalococcoidia bacterium]|nr:SNF2-related protein [Dehalococcoidia bacterium]